MRLIRLSIMGLGIMALLLAGCSGGTGSVVVETTPPGAEVYLQNTRIGTTPLFVPEVKEGRVRLALRREGYQNALVDVVVIKDREVVVTEELMPTFTTLRQRALSLSDPTSPVQLLLLNTLGALDVASETYWHEVTQIGFGVVFTQIVEGQFREQTASRLPRDKDTLGFLGLSSTWSVREVGKEIALVRLGESKPFIVVRDGQRWMLLRMMKDHEDYERVTEEEVVTNSESWLRTVTGMDLFEALADLVSDEQQPNESPEEPNPRWRTTRRWSGSGVKDTESFTIKNDEWQIQWSTRNERLAGVFQIYVYDTSGSLVSLAANHMGVGSDSTYVRGSGDFYLSVLAANIDWEISVLDYH